MIKVTIQDGNYNRIEFQFADCEVAGKFMDVAMASAVGEVSFKLERANEPDETVDTLKEA